MEFFHNQNGGAHQLLGHLADATTTSGTTPAAARSSRSTRNPKFIHTPDGEIARPRINSWNSTFSLKRSKAQYLHFQGGERYTLPGNGGTSVFDDTLDWWYDSDEHGSHASDHYQPGWYGVDVPKTGTTVSVKKMMKNGTMVSGSTDPTPSTRRPPGIHPRGPTACRGATGSSAPGVGSHPWPSSRQHVVRPVRLS